MPEIVNEFPKDCRGRRLKWEPYFDGQIWKFTKADLKAFSIKSLEGLRAILYERCRRVAGRHARIHRAGEVLYMQSFMGEPAVPGRPRVMSEVG